MKSVFRGDRGVVGRVRRSFFEGVMFELRLVGRGGVSQRLLDSSGWLSWRVGLR